MIASLHAREDDLYSGYGREDVAPDLDTEGLQFDEGFQVYQYLFSGTLIKKIKNLIFLIYKEIRTGAVITVVYD